MENYKEYLPIGSVVRLKGGQKKLMIFGISQNIESPDKSIIEYDYIAVPFPEGNLGVNQQYVFQHSEIEEVFFRGFINSERQEFITAFGDYMNNKDKK